MSLRQSAITSCVVLGLAQAAWAQESRVPSASVEQPAAPQVASAGNAAPAAGLDVSRLPIDVQRIQRGLAQTTREREERDGLNLRYVIDVFGQAPAIELFTREDNLRNGPVPYGAPTHRDMIYMMTPQEFRSPAMDFNSLFRWLSDKAKK